MEEQRKGFLQGPFASKLEVKEFFGVDEFVCSHRLALENARG